MLPEEVPAQATQFSIILQQQLSPENAQLNRSLGFQDVFGMFRIISVSFLLGVLCLAATTYIALESGGVVTVETVQPGTQAVRETHVWFVRDAEEIFLEAGHPNNRWVRDLDHLTKIRLSGSEIDGTYGFIVHKGSEGHKKIRSLMRSKYGWRDRWISLLFNVSESSLVEVRKVVIR